MVTPNITPTLRIPTRTAASGADQRKYHHRKTSSTSSFIDEIEKNNQTIKMVKEEKHNKQKIMNIDSTFNAADFDAEMKKSLDDGVKVLGILGNLIDVYL